MGVIGNQPERVNYASYMVSDLSDELKEMIRLAKYHEVSLADVIALRECLIKQGTAALKTVDGDYRDEHAGGYYDAMKEIAESLRSISEAIQSTI